MSGQLSNRQYGGVPAAQRLDDRRQRLQSAVVTVIGRQGWAAATVRAVAAEAGVGPRFLYESYRDIEDLATQAYNEIGAELISDAVQRFTEQPDAAASIHAAVDSIVAGLLQDDDRARFLLSEAPRLTERRNSLIRTAANELARQSTDDEQERTELRRRGIFAAGGGLELVRARLDGDRALDAGSITDTITSAIIGPP